MKNTYSSAFIEVKCYLLIIHFSFNYWIISRLIILVREREIRCMYPLNSNKIRDTILKLCYISNVFIKHVCYTDIYSALLFCWLFIVDYSENGTFSNTNIHIIKKWFIAQTYILFKFVAHNKKYLVHAWVKMITI